MTQASANRHEWEEPGLHKVFDGVYRIPLPLPNDALRAVNVYAITEGDQVTLIDSGWALDAARSQLDDALSQIGAGLGDVRRFLITHVHRDHYNQAIALRKEFGIPIGAGAGERADLEALNDPDAIVLGPQRELLRICGATTVLAELERELRGATIDPDEWQLADEWFSDRQLLSIGERTMQVIETPGHTRGHVVYRDAEHELLFAGDHVLPHITPSIALEPRPGELPLGDYLGSLRLVRELPDTHLLPAHGPVVESSHIRIDELLEHHDVRLEQSLDTIRQGAETAADAANILRWTRRQKKISEMDPFNAMLAIIETKSHLDLLVHQGKLSSEDIDGVRNYRLG